jgi:hypothetical protein
MADADGMEFIWETVILLSFQTGFVVAPENLISEAKNYLQLPPRRFNTNKCYQN